MTWWHDPHFKFQSPWTSKHLFPGIFSKCFSVFFLNVFFILLICFRTPVWFKVLWWIRISATLRCLSQSRMGGWAGEKSKGGTQRHFLWVKSRLNQLTINLYRWYGYNFFYGYETWMVATSFNTPFNTPLNNWIRSLNTLSFNFPLCHHHFGSCNLFINRTWYILIFTQPCPSRYQSNFLVQLSYMIQVLLMKEILHQLRLVDYPIIYKVLPPSQVVGLGFSEPSGCQNGNFDLPLRAAQAGQPRLGWRLHPAGCIYGVLREIRVAWVMYDVYTMHHI